MANRELLNDILNKYTTGEYTVEEANKLLAENEFGIYLNPEKKGNCLVDSGIGQPDVHMVEDGKLVGGSAPMCDIYYDGKVWHNEGDDPTLLPGGFPRAAAGEILPDRPDMGRKLDLAGTVQEQKTKAGVYEVHYNEDGYAVKAVRK